MLSNRMVLLVLHVASAFIVVLSSSLTSSKCQKLIADCWKSQIDVRRKLSVHDWKDRQFGDNRDFKECTKGLTDKQNTSFASFDIRFTRLGSRMRVELLGRASRFNMRT